MRINGVDYVTGHDRNDSEDKLVVHLYRGTFQDTGDPMCARGWNRVNGEGYSIFRNAGGGSGLCKVCRRRAVEGRPPVSPRPRETRWL